VDDHNNVRKPSVTTFEPASAGIGVLIRPPTSGGNPLPTLHDSYGMAGQPWAFYGLRCSDMTSLIGSRRCCQTWRLPKSPQDSRT
jgi:hypothetical protein